MNNLKTLLTAAVLMFVALASVAFAENMVTITIGENPAPIEVVMIIYSDRDHDATVADFVKTNPQHAAIVLTGFLEPGASFQAPN